MTVLRNHFIQSKTLLLLLHCCSLQFFVSTGEIDFNSINYFSSMKSDPRLDAKKPPKSLAIVGGGIGGTSSAYFMRKIFGNDISIDVYESSKRLCGRVASVTINNLQYESGGSLIHDKNMYAKAAAKAFGLQNCNSLDTITSFFDGKDYLLKTSPWSIITFLKFLWSFGFDFFHLYWLEEDFMSSFTKIYDFHSKGQSYSSVKNLLQILDVKFVNASQITGCKLFNDGGLHSDIIKMLVNGGIRNNYGQTCSVNGFVSMVSMAGIQPNLWSIKGGNKQLCEQFFEHSESNLVNEKVLKVSKQPDEKFKLISTSLKRMYDIVVIATPINQDKSRIDVCNAFTGKGVCPSAIDDPRHFRRTVATFVKGSLNSTLFKCDSLSSCPGTIFTTENLFYRSIGLHTSVNFDPKKDTPFDDAIYKVFSTESLTDDQLSFLFENVSINTEVDWYAYPYYSPPDRLDTFVLNENGLFYTSPIEWAASAIEMSMISAKNIALLAFNYWYNITENIDTSLNLNKHSEL